MLWSVCLSHAVELYSTHSLTKGIHNFLHIPGCVSLYFVPLGKKINTLLFCARQIILLSQASPEKGRSNKTINSANNAIKPWSQHTFQPETKQIALAAWINNITDGGISQAANFFLLRDFKKIKTWSTRPFFQILSALWCRVREFAKSYHIGFRYSWETLPITSSKGIIMQEKHMQNNWCYSNIFSISLCHHFDR